MRVRPWLFWRRRGSKLFHAHGCRIDMAWLLLLPALLVRQYGWLLGVHRWRPASPRLRAPSSCALPAAGVTASVSGFSAATASPYGFPASTVSGRRHRARDRHLRVRHRQPASLRQCPVSPRPPHLHPASSCSCWRLASATHQMDGVVLQ